MSWTFSAPDGVYKNHTLSSKIRLSAIANTHFMRWATPEPGYGKGKGESVTLTFIDELPTTGTVNELDRLPSHRPDITTRQITVKERGIKIPMTQFEENLTHFDLTNRFQMRLRDHMALHMDAACATALKTTPIKAIGTSATGVTFDMDGTASTAASNNLSTAHLGEIFDFMHGTLKIPMVNGQATSAS